MKKANRFRFRAWHKESKRMAYDVQEEYDTIAGVRFEGTDDEPGEECFGNYLHDVVMDSNYEATDEHEYAVMQSTGKLDKNKKEVFEGDVIDAGKYHGVSAVIWANGSWKISGACSKIGFCSWVDQVEVIGNIYENPELIKESK